MSGKTANILNGVDIMATKGMFYYDLNDGKRGEAIVKKALEARTHTVIDMSDNAEYRFMDIDFCLSNRKGQQTTLEVKNDLKSESTGNVFVEYQNDNTQSHSYKGWFFYCRAEYICFVQETAHKAHIVLMEELKDDIKANKYRTRRGQNAMGYLVPIEALARLPSYIWLEV